MPLKMINERDKGDKRLKMSVDIDAVKGLKSLNINAAKNVLWVGLSHNT